MSKVIALILFCVSAYCSIDLSISGYVFLAAWLGFMIALFAAIEPEESNKFWNGK